MSLRNTGENPSPADILAAASELNGNDNRADDADTSTAPGREAVREYIEECVDAGDTVHVRARRILVEIGADTPISGSAVAGRTFDRGAGVDPQDIGRTLAAMRRGVTPDDFLPHVDVSQWRETGDGGLTTWKIEVGRDD